MEQRKDTEHQQIITDMQEHLRVLGYIDMFLLHVPSLSHYYVVYN